MFAIAMLFAPVRWGAVPTAACSICKYNLGFYVITLEGCDMVSMLYNVTDKMHCIKINGNEPSGSIKCWKILE
jgi:hypothetical protein